MPQDRFFPFFLPVRRVHLARAGLSVPTLLLLALVNPGPGPAATAPGVSFADTTTVDGNGSASLTLPLPLPEGTGGVTPQISLVYGSGQGNGLLGVGWFLTGMHSVVRCAPTIAQDGFAGGVTFTSADRFCLDGQRLVPISGAQGGDGTVYRTEIDGFVKVVSRWNNGQPCGGGPCTFTAHAGNGVTMTFGANGSGFAGLGAPAGIVAVWAVNSVTDSDGNFTTFTYQANASTGEYHVSNVTYSGVGLTNTRGIDFTYAGNTSVDAVTLYQAGVATSTTVRLSGIKVKTTIGGVDSPVASLSIAYETGPTTGRSRITSITECGRTGPCGAPLALTWSDPVGKATRPSYASTGNVSTGLTADPDKDLFFSGDFYGSGKSDVARINTGSGLIDVLAFATGGPVTRKTWQSQVSVQCASAALVGGFNGDSLTDILCVGPHGSSFSGTLYRWSPSADAVVKQTWSPQNAPSNVNRRFFAADVNGDGITDLVLLGQSGQNMTVSTYLGTASGLSEQPTSGPSVPAGFSSLASVDMEAAGVTGNGVAALVYPVTVGSAIQLRVLTHLTDIASKTLSWSAPGLPANLGSNFDLTFGDLNGDGSADPVFIYNGANGRMAQPYLSTGTGLVARGAALSFGSTVASVLVADFNGDGLDDIGAIQVMGAGGQLSVSLSGGNGERTTWATFTSPVNGTAPVLQGDFSGHGFAEMLQLLNQGGKWLAQTFFGTPYSVPGQANPPPADLLTGVANGIGATSTIAYAPLTNATTQVYTKDSSAVYPYQDIQDAGYVVSVLNKSDGMAACPAGAVNGHCFTYTYAYAGSVRNAQGRGWSGFTQVTAFDPQAGRASVTSYATRFPFTHLVLDSGMEALLGSALVPMNSRKLVKQYCTMGGGGTPTGARTDGDAVDCASEAAKPVNAFFSGIYQVQQVLEATGIYPNPQAAVPNPKPASTLVKTYNYDGYGNVVMVSDLGDVSDPGNQPVYTCSSYNAPPTDLGPGGAWQLGYPLDTKERTSPAGCLAGTVFSSWTAGTDLSWERNVYNSGWQALYNAQFLNGSVPDAKNPACAAAVAGGTWLCTSYTYDRWGNVVTVTDPRNVTASFTFDSTFHTYVVAQISPSLANGNRLTVTRTFDLALGVELSVTDPNGNTITYTYDDFARPLTESLPAPTNGSAVLAKSYTYAAGSPAGWVASVASCASWRDCGTVSSAWYQSSQSFDGMGRGYSSTRDGATPGNPIAEVVSYDSAGRVAGRSLPYFAQTGTARWNSTAYDLYDRPVLTCGPLDSLSGQVTVQTRAYDNTLRTTTRQTFASGTCSAAAANAKSVIQTTVSLYDPRGLMVRETAPDDGTTRLYHDPLGRIVKRVGPMDSGGSDTTVYTYDSLSRTTFQSDPTRGPLALSYDAQGNQVKMTDGAGNGIAQVYDVLARPLSQTLTDPQSKVVETSQFVYDSGVNAKGRLSSASNAAAAHTMAYDRMGNQSVFTTSAAGLNLTFGAGYDPLQRQVSDIGADGSVTRTTYGRNLLPVAVDYCSAGTRSFSNIATYGDYTALGKYQSRSYGNGLSSSFTYDVIGRLSTAATSKGGTALTSSALTWRAASNPPNVLSKITDVLVAGQSQTLGYDPVGRLTSASGPYPATSLGYDKGGNITSWTVGGSTTTFTPSASAAYRLSGASGPAGKDTFGYLGNGAMSSRTVGGGAGNLGYAYTPDSLLTTASRNGAMASAMTYGPSRDVVTETEAGGTATLWLGPGLHRTVTTAKSTLWTTSIVGQDGVVATITAASFTPSNDASGCLGAMSAAGGTTDGGSWPEGSASLPARGTMAALALAALAMIVLGSVGRLGRLARRVAVMLLALAVGLSGMPPAALAALLPGPNGPGIEQVGIRYFSRDTVLSPDLVTDGSGKETARVSYLPFGVVNPGASSGTNDFREKFGGNDEIGTTGLLNFGARVYDPSLGRFLTPDPAGQYDNPYSYAGNDPYGRTDSDGRFSTKAYFGGMALTHPPPSTVARGQGGAMSPGKVLLKIGEMAALIALSVACPEAGVAIGVAFASYDTVRLVRDPSVANGLALGFDIVTLGLASAESAVAEDAMQAESGAARGMKGGAGEDPVESGLANERAGQGKTPGGDEATCGGASFAAGTRIRTRDGAKAVEDLRPGDEVLASAAPDAQWRPITRLFTRQADDAVDLVVGGETLHTTARHPFLTMAGAWVAAGDLHPGDTLARSDGKAATVVALRPVKESTRVYNLEVAGLHAYAVGRSGVLVHNVLTVTCHYDTNGRKTYAETTISKSDLNTGTGTSEKTRDFVKEEAEFTKLQSGKWDPNSGITDEYPDAGHIFANRLGGSGKDIENIFPQALSINRGPYRTFEGEVYDYVKANGTVSARVDFIYNDNSHVPSAVRYRVWNGKSLADEKFENFQ